MTHVPLGTRRGPAAALAAALAACATAPAPAPPAAPPDPAAALQGCVTGQVDRVRWRAHCPGLVAEVADPYGEPAPALQAAGIDRVAEVGAGAASAEPARLRLGGAEREATRLRVGSWSDPARPRAEGLVATVPFGEERTRLVWCAARPSAGAGRCDVVVAALAALPWRAGLPAGGPLPPELAGRPLAVPPGCEVQAAEAGVDLTCGRTDVLRWRRGEPAAPPIDGRPCRVEGLATRCAVSEGWGGGTFTAATVVELRGASWAVSCTWAGDPDSPSAACDGLELAGASGP
jgi:hypothetical protein